MKTLSKILGTQFQVWMKKDKDSDWQPTTSIGNDEKTMEHTGEKLKEVEGWHKVKVEPLGFQADLPGCETSQVEAAVEDLEKDFQVTWLKNPISFAQFEKICDYYENKFVKATLRWFDSASGQGQVRLSEGPLKDFSITVHGSAFGGDVNFGQNTAFEPKDGMAVLVRLMIDSTTLMVAEMKQASQSSVLAKLFPVVANTGTLLWFDKKDQNGIVKDESGNEWYIDVSVFSDKSWVPQRGDKISFEPNPKPGFKNGTKNVKKA